MKLSERIGILIESEKPDFKSEAPDLDQKSFDVIYSALFHLLLNDQDPKEKVYKVTRGSGPTKTVLTKLNKKGYIEFEDKSSVVRKGSRSASGVWGNNAKNVTVSKYEYKFTDKALNLINKLAKDGTLSNYVKSNVG